jgi:hypothetical protein
LRGGQPKLGPRPEAQGIEHVERLTEVAKRGIDGMF